MIFYGKGYVWDAQNNCDLCKFENGVFETEAPRIIKILQGLGYKSEFGDDVVVDCIEVESEESEDDDLEQLKATAKEYGLKGYGNIKDPDKLREWIAERVD